ncbi:hypothetical protein B0H21DRAFT_819023 [Amylocystis lapponica]|nr:hypothetical protein B0H21DRAFT_819023 [Amylocystis lapponica]
MIIKSPFPPVPPLPDQNVHDFIFTRPDAALAQDYVLHIDAATGHKRTSAEFRERVRDGATALGAPPSAGGLGLCGEEHEIVGILSHNALDYVVLVHALLALATPFALLSAYATPFELGHALRTARATRLFVQPALCADVRRAAQEAGLPEDRIYVLEGRLEGKVSFGDMIDRVRLAGVPRVPVRAAKKDTLAYLVFSSGTTGLPKAVMISHGNIMFSLKQYGIGLQVEAALRPADVTPPWLTYLEFLPIYHTFGLHVLCFRGLIRPSTHVVMPQWNLELALKVIPRYRISVLYIIPSVLHQLVHHKHLRPDMLASVLFVGSGAAYLPPQLAQHFKNFMRRDIDVGQGFGMSEVTLSATRQVPPGMLGAGFTPSPGSTGVLLPGMEARVVRDDGADAALGEDGELWLRGGNVALGYWGNARATAETFVAGGWLRTGDKFRADAAGQLFFIDRMKDTLKVSGLQVSPTEIEDLLMAHPEGLVADVCVGGVSGGRTSDEKVPRAWVVLSVEGRRRDLRKTLEAVEAWSRKNLSKYKWLRGGIEVVNEIPKSPTGKVLRRVLQERYEAQVSRPSVKL